MFKPIIGRVRNSPLARNTLWMSAGFGLRLVVQAVYFVLIARSLGSQGYGAFIGVCSFVAILASFSGLGRANILIKNVARNAESFKRYWGHALLMILMSGSVLLVIVLGASRFVLPASIPFSLVFIVAVSDLFFSGALDLSGRAFQAFQQLGRTAQLQVLPNILRLFAIAGLAFYVKAPTALQWGYLYLVTAVISALIGIWIVHKELGLPLFTLAGMRAEMAEGFFFSVSLSAQSIYNDIDKTMLARFSTLSATGIYGSAYRIIDVSFTPIRSLLYAAYARFFQHGEGGILGSLGLAKKLFPIAGGYGIFSGIILVVTAPLLPYVLGREYAAAAAALRWLAPLPFIKSIHYFAADTLTGAGFQKVRSGIQVFVAFFNVGINLWLIPAYAWRGAAWASIASDGLLALLLCIIVFYLASKEQVVVGVPRAVKPNGN